MSDIICTGCVTNVTVSGTGLTTGAADLYEDCSWARRGATLQNGSNNYTALAKDSYGRESTDTASVYSSASVTFTYDLNGNLTGDGLRVFEYDYENQLTNVYGANQWRSEFAYDALMRRRGRKEFTWSGSAWVKTNEVRYVYDGRLVIQERDENNVPRVTYTRGLDLSGSLEGAGGIGGLLARSEISNFKFPHAYYHADGNGNITCLVDGNGTVVARYTYDPYGNILSMSGPLAEANLYRFSSKEAHPTSGLVYYLYRYYDPTLQRWINRDPIGEKGGLNLFRAFKNNASIYADNFGLDESAEPGSISKIKQWFCDFASTVYDYVPDVLKEFLADKADAPVGKTGPTPGSSIPGGVGAVANGVLEGEMAVAQSGPGLTQVYIMSTANNKANLSDPFDADTFFQDVENQQKMRHKCAETSKALEKFE